MKIAPSILSTYNSSLEESINILNQLQVDFIHLDVMDHQFVPNQTFDYHLVKKIRNMTSLLLDTHLMIATAEEDYQKYIDAGSNIITFHYEAVKNPLKLINKIKATGIKVGISIKPSTDVTKLNSLLSEVDLILVMSVEPGFGGQKFLTSALDKIKYLNQKRIDQQYQYLIEVDGGINNQNVQAIQDAGADIIVVGSYLMNSDNIFDTYQKLKIK